MACIALGHIRFSHCAEFFSTGFGFVRFNEAEEQLHEHHKMLLIRARAAQTELSMGTDTKSGEEISNCWRLGLMPLLLDKLQESCRAGC